MAFWWEPLLHGVIPIVGRLEERHLPGLKWPSRRTFGMPWPLGVSGRVSVMSLFGVKFVFQSKYIYCFPCSSILHSAFRPSLFSHLIARATSRLSGSAKVFVAFVFRQPLHVCCVFDECICFVRSCQHVFGVLFQLSFTCMSVHLPRSADTSAEGTNPR